MTTFCLQQHFARALIVRNDPFHRYEALTTAHDELALFQEQRRKLLRLDDFATISVREAVAGQHFIKKIEQLRIPSRMKSFLNADYTAQLSRGYLTRIYSKNHADLVEFL